jgi:hypothetical protein
MGIDTEVDFCLRREREERAAAAGATCLAVHDAHFVMAERYADRASSLIERRLELKQSGAASKQLAPREGNTEFHPVTILTSLGIRPPIRDEAGSRSQTPAGEPTVEELAAALRTKFGYRALRVATKQIEEAGNETVGRWLAVYTKLKELDASDPLP